MLVGVMQLQKQGQDVKEMLQAVADIVGNINSFSTFIFRIPKLRFFLTSGQ